ncbi:MULTISPECIES: hypothetical protein [unclassified Peribacillus]
MFTESVGRLLKPQEIIADIVAFPRRNENYLLGIYEGISDKQRKLK